MCTLISKGDISYIVDEIAVEDSYNHPSMCFQPFDEHLDLPRMVCSLNYYNTPWSSVSDAEIWSRTWHFLNLSLLSPCI